MTLEEFEQQPLISADTFFTRANYDHLKKEFKPAYSKWDKICSCKKPCNPMQQYIMCESCSQWFHPKCEGATADEENFICKNCNSNK